MIGRRDQMIIQIYEIQTPEEAETMIALGVDHVGSVLISKEKWQDPVLRQAIQLVQSSGRKSSLIPLFGEVDTVSRSIDYYQPDLLHFCETLPPKLEDNKRLDAIVSLQKTIKERYPELEIMRSIPIGTKGNGDVVPSLGYATVFEPWSDWFLTDTLIANGDSPDDLDQPVAGFVGITGQNCDWDIARQLVQQSRIPVILAGGIEPDNVSAGISHVMPVGVDSCTLTNAVNLEGLPQRFQKDPEKVRKFIQKARAAADDK
jgi:phosphoribosylanthranilate isomerase